MPNIVVVGGGVQGLMMAYDLSAHGHRVTVLEAAPRAGGLVCDYPIPECGELRVDRFYHCILSSDVRILALCDELGLADRMRFTTTRMAFFGKDRGLHSMSTPREFLTFPLVSLPARIRLGVSLLWAARTRPGDWMESTPVEDWLRRIGGDQNFDELWGPLLQSKFDDDFSRLPASYMWSRLKRMTSTRDGKGAEQMGHIVGGYQTLVDALCAAIQRQDGEIRTSTPVFGISLDGQGQANGVQLAEGCLSADLVVLTVSNPLIRRWLPNAPQVTTRPLADIGYMAVVSALLVLDRRLTPYYTINIVNRSLSLTGVIETTNIIDPKLLGGSHLVYLPKYCAQHNPLLDAPKEAVLEDFLAQLVRIVPTFRREWIKASRVFTARETEPVHSLAPKRRLVPYDTGVPGVFVANSTQVHPDLVNCEAMCANVKRALTHVHRAATKDGQVGATSLSSGCKAEC